MYPFTPTGRRINHLLEASTILSRTVVFYFVGGFVGGGGGVIVAVVAAGVGVDVGAGAGAGAGAVGVCLLYTSPSPRDKRQSRMPSSA